MWTIVFRKNLLKALLRTCPVLCSSHGAGHVRRTTLGQFLKSYIPLNIQSTTASVHTLASSSSVFLFLLCSLRYSLCIVKTDHISLEELQKDSLLCMFTSQEDNLATTKEYVRNNFVYHS